MKPSFAAIILGGTGQVGGAAVTELLAIPECREVVMITRKPIAARSRMRNVVLDTGAADFAALIHMTTTAKSGGRNPENAFRRPPRGQLPAARLRGH